MVSDNPVKASAAALALTAWLLAGCATSAPGVVPSVATRLNATELVALSAKASRAEQRLYDLREHRSNGAHQKNNGRNRNAE